MPTTFQAHKRGIQREKLSQKHHTASSLSLSHSPQVKRKQTRPLFQTQRSSRPAKQSRAKNGLTRTPKTRTNTPTRNATCAHVSALIGPGGPRALPAWLFSG